MAGQSREAGPEGRAVVAVRAHSPAAAPLPIAVRRRRCDRQGVPPVPDDARPRHFPRLAGAFAKPACPTARRRPAIPRSPAAGPGRCWHCCWPPRRWPALRRRTPSRPLPPQAATRCPCSSRPTASNTTIPPTPSPPAAMSSSGGRTSRSAPMPSAGTARAAPSSPPAMSTAAMPTATRHLPTA